MSKYIRILSIDGGGILGIIPAEIIMYIEDKLKIITGNDNLKISDCFDLIAGTSTGGILTCLYLCPDKFRRSKYTAKEALDVYLEKGNEVFCKTFFKTFNSINGIIDEKYSSISIEDLFDEYFNLTKLSELVKPCLITSYDIEKRETKFFTRDEAILNKKFNFYLKDIARSTSAAPTFFEASNIKSLSGDIYSLIDGAVFANNPSMCALIEAMKIYNKKSKSISPKEVVLLSLGTGENKKKFDFDKVKNWGLIEWAKPLFEIIMSGVSETVDYQLNKLFDSNNVSNQYLRITPDLPIINCELDNVDLENIKKLSEIGKDEIEKNKNRLNSIINLLLEE